MNFFWFFLLTTRFFLSETSQSTSAAKQIQVHILTVTIRYNCTTISIVNVHEHSLLFGFDFKVFAVPPFCTGINIIWLGWRVGLLYYKADPPTQSNDICACAFLCTCDCLATKTTQGKTNLMSRKSRKDNSTLRSNIRVYRPSQRE